MRGYQVFLVLLFSSLVAFGQVTKDQIYALTEKQVDESVIVSLIQTNCVDFELDGATTVELAGRVSSEVLRTIVDCVREKEALEAEEAEGSASLAETPATPVESPPAAKSAPETQTIRESNAFQVPSYITVILDSNKTSFDASEVEFRIFASRSGDVKELRYRFTGEAALGEEIRCYKKSGPETLAPGEYSAYLYMVSHRKKGIGIRKEARTDLIKYRAEAKGPGPITLKIHSREEKTFSSKKALSVEAFGPIRLFNEDVMSMEGEKNVEDLLEGIN